MASPRLHGQPGSEHHLSHIALPRNIKESSVTLHHPSFMIQGTFVEGEDTVSRVGMVKSSDIGKKKK